MASATNESKNSDNVDCSICTETFRNPCLLDCKHIFCETCIHTWIERLSKDCLPSQLSGIECPLCRKITRPPDNQLPPRKWASSLPRATLSDLQNKTYPKPPRCDPCARGSEFSFATVCCVDCTEFLCLECEKCHKKLKPTSSHQVCAINKEHDIEDSQFLQDYHKLLMCERHPEKQIEFWCDDHSEVFCATCAIVAHRSCSDVQEISNTTISDIGSFGIYVSKKRMEVLKTHLDDTVTVYKEYKHNIATDRDTIQKQVKERKAKVMKTIETEISQLLSSSRNMAVEVSSSIESNLSVITTKIKQLERSITVTEKFADMVQGDKHYFIVNSRLEKLLDKYKKDIEEIRSEAKTEFTRVRLSKENNIHNPKYFIGVLEVYTAAVLLPEIPDFKSMDKKDMLVPAFGMNGEAKKVCKIGSFFSSCDYFTDNVSVFSDNRNKRLIKYNHKNEEIIAEIKTKTEPWTVRVLQKTIVVSFPTEKKIVTFDGQLKALNSFSTTKCCYSFDELNDNNLLVCEENLVNSMVYATYDLATGETKSRIDPDRKKLQTNSHIFVDSNILYRLSESENSVIALNLKDMSEKFKYKDEKLVWPTGIDMDVEGNIYVCGLRSKNIHMLDEDGGVIRIFDLARYGLSPTFMKLSGNDEDLILLGDANNPGPFFFKLK